MTFLVVVHGCKKYVMQGNTDGCTVFENLKERERERERERWREGGRERKRERERESHRRTNGENVGQKTAGNKRECREMFQSML